MKAYRRMRVSAACFLVSIACVAPVAAQSAAPASPAVNAKTWLDQRAQIEEYLIKAEVVTLKDIGTGVTNPKKAELAAGGLVEAMAWKPIRPGIYSGFWESYKSEIAAYELDKLLELNMVPPTVERRVRNDLGAAVMWIAPTKSFKEFGRPPTPPSEHLDLWNMQLIRAKMFDNLIYNKDPNLGNWLVDPAWNLILIDHTRSFTTGKDMVHTMTRIDANLWERMKGLTQESLTAAIGKWLGKGEIRAILQRRDKMQELIDKMVAKQGEAAVFVR